MAFTYFLAKIEIKLLRPCNCMKSWISSLRRVRNEILQNSCSLTREWPPYKPDVLWKRVLFMPDDRKWNSSSSRRVFHLHFRYMSREFANLVSVHRKRPSRILYKSALNYNKSHYNLIIRLWNAVAIFISAYVIIHLTRFNATFTVSETRGIAKKFLLPGFPLIFLLAPILNSVRFLRLSRFVFPICNSRVISIYYTIILRDYYS